MNAFTKLIAGSIAAFAVSATANASLIVNGGFEDTDVNGGDGGWQWYTSSNVDGWEGSNIEIWQDFGAIGPYEGNQHAELNAHPSSGDAFSIFQSFETNPGDTYELFFAYGARRNNDESFQVQLDGIGVGSLLDQLIDDHTVNAWSTFSYVFTADSTSTTLRFTSVTPESGTVGNFLDGISVVAVPAPGTLLLLGTALMGLGLRRRK
ncbi:MAG: DUF642 domain-containing protein [Pseudomonadota bacterium]